MKKILTIFSLVYGITVFASHEHIDTMEQPKTTEDFKKFNEQIVAYQSPNLDPKQDGAYILESTNQKTKNPTCFGYLLYHKPFMQFNQPSVTLSRIIRKNAANKSSKNKNNKNLSIRRATRDELEQLTKAIRNDDARMEFFDNQETIKILNNQGR